MNLIVNTDCPLVIARNLIGASWRDGEEVAVENPSDLSRPAGRAMLGTAADVADAISAAEAALPGWSRATPEFRADILHRCADLILAETEDLALILSTEQGKPLTAARGEVQRAARVFRFHAGEAFRTAGVSQPSVRPGVHVETAREPLGVVGLITPWNFPIAIPAWKAAPALAAGCTVVLKPSELTPLTAFRLVSLVRQAGLPDGVLNMVIGTGSDAGRALVDDPRVAGISFTGSLATGRAVAVAAVGRGARIQTELGSKNALIVEDSADIDTAVACAVDGAFHQTGQRCTASSRIITTPGIHDAFMTAFVARTAQLVAGHALAPGSDLGPATCAAQLEKTERYIAIGRDEGAALVCGGERPERETEGHYLTPAIFTDCRSDMRICQEEIFGPVASVLAADDLDHALALANDTPFGLSAGIATCSLAAAARFRARIRAGIATVNLPTAGVDYHVPFGGKGLSSNGPREQGRDAADFYTSTKTIYTCPEPGANH